MEVFAITGRMDRKQTEFIAGPLTQAGYFDFRSVVGNRYA